MKRILHLVAILPVLVLAQTQIGQDIDGEAGGDRFGFSVSLSSDGFIIAIGAPANDVNGNASGHVRIFENQGGAWVQLGNDINGEAAGDNSGYSVSLSSDGSIVAIGATRNDGNGADSGHVRVYENQLNTWVQIGQDIDGEAEDDESGLSVSLSSDGSIVAIGAWFSDDSGSESGHVRVYENQSNTWVQIGSDIDGESTGDESGSSVSLSSDGSIVAIGATNNDGNGSSSGHVRVYENQSNSWVQIGQDIDGEAAGDNSGQSVSLSSDGSIIAVGASSNDGNGIRSGHVRVYENQSDNWVQIGNDIDGEVAGDQSGVSVSLSSDGSIVAIGAYLNGGNGNTSGHVRVYENQSGSWTQVGDDIDGEAVGDWSGFSVSLSSNGSVVAIGAYLNDGSGNDSGHVRAYNLSTVLSIESLKQDYFSYYPNPVKDALHIDLNSGIKLEQINIYNSLGQYLYSTKTTTINVSNLNSGLYFIEVETNKGKSTKKIVVE